MPAPSCTFVPGRGLQTPLRGRVSDSDGLLPRPSTPGRVRPRKALRRAYTTSEESRCRRSGNAPHLRSGRGRGAALRKCDDTHLRNAALDLHRPPGWGLIDPSPPRERNSSDRPPQSSGGAPARPEELTRGVEIPGKPGGFASTRWPGRTEMLWSISQRDPRQADHRYKARRARITGSANRL